MSSFNSIKKIGIFYLTPIALWISLFIAIYDGWAGENAITITAIILVSYLGLPFGFLIGLVAIGIASYDELLEHKKLHVSLSLLILFAILPTWMHFVPKIGS